MVAWRRASSLYILIYDLYFLFGKFEKKNKESELVESPDVEPIDMVPLDLELLDVDS